MGTCCEPSEITSSALVDLPKPKTDGIKDQIERWEKSQPWARCYFKAYLKHLDMAKNDTFQPDGDQYGYVSYDALCQKFSTPAWKVLKDKKG